MHFDTQTGERLKDERKRLRLSQQAIADTVGVRREMWAKYEAGAEPGAGVLASACDAGVDVVYVLTGRRQVSYPSHAQSATVTPIGTSESSGLTQLQVLAMVIDALHKLGKSLPSKAVFAVVEAVMALQRAGATVNKSAVEAQLRLVR